MEKCVLLLTLLFGSITTRDPASLQLTEYNKTHNESSFIQTRYGAPVSDITSSLTVGPRGPILLQDAIFLDTMSHFDRERIPERVVHAKGSGGFGTFTVTHDITNYTRAVVFERVGKTTNIAIRFSIVSISLGGADTTRDPRGFAIKFYTEDGIWDLVGNNTPIFFIRDPMLFPMFIHSQKGNPVTNVRDADMFWDFITLREETVYQVLWLFSDLGTPDGFRYMHGYGSNTFKMVNAQDEAVYVKFHYLSNQGIRNLMAARATELAGTDPDYATRDLYNAIANATYPSWNLSIQVMTFDEAEKFRWNPFDVTKIWPEDEYPLKPVGTLVLDKNPTNHFAQMEQIAFSPANMIPGIEPSPDKLLQGRLFAYSDTQRYRLGVNHLQLPVNCPFHVTNYQRDGASTNYNQDGAPNYYPNSFGGPKNMPSAASSTFSLTGDVKRYNSSVEDNFTQATMFWNKLTKEQQTNTLNNIAEHLKNASPIIQKRAFTMFEQVNCTMGSTLQTLIEQLK
ncbi:catalase-like isoform X1 [Periplaneta americana]|uniref:catalase-like isoform X1 n=2 Tax=Periplaneta americana TaxID=6978 RepID=UPI0037E739F0